MKHLYTAAALSAAITMTGCQTTQSVYKDPGAAEPAVKTTRWQAQDVQSTALKMVDSLLNDPELFGQGKPSLRFSGIRNKTSQHIDTKRLSDRIRTHLIKSRKARILSDMHADADRRKDAMAEAKFSKSRYANQAQKKKTNFSSASYHLHGEISEIHSTDSRAASRAYQITLNLHDIQTDELLWADIKDIEKVKGKSIW